MEHEKVIFRRIFACVMEIASRQVVMGDDEFFHLVFYLHVFLLEKFH